MSEFLASLSDDDAAQVVGAMREVAAAGLKAARHLPGDIYEVRAYGDRATYRVLFAPEGRWGHIRLAQEAFSKKTPTTPSRKIEVAEMRLADWRAGGQICR